MEHRSEAAAGLRRVELLPEPIAELGRSSRQFSQVAHMIVAMATRAETIVVLMNPEREVFALTGWSSELAAARYSDWLVGTYTHTVSPVEVSADLVALADELKAMSAN